MTKYWRTILEFLRLIEPELCSYKLVTDENEITREVEKVNDYFSVIEDFLILRDNRCIQKED